MLNSVFRFTGVLENIHQNVIKKTRKKNKETEIQRDSFPSSKNFFVLDKIISILGVKGEKETHFGHFPRLPGEGVVFRHEHVHLSRVQTVQRLRNRPEILLHYTPQNDVLRVRFRFRFRFMIYVHIHCLVPGRPFHLFNSGGFLFATCHCPLPVQAKGSNMSYLTLCNDDFQFGGYVDFFPSRGGGSFGFFVGL